MGSETALRPSSRRAFLTAAAASLGAAACAPSPLLAPAATPSPARELRVRTPLPSDRQGFNRRWYAPSLEAVYIPRDADDVVAHVDDALRTYGRDVKVTSGRHGYEAFVYNDSTRAIIDMSSVNRVGNDPERGEFFVDAGAENWTVYRTLLNGYGRTLPAGSCYSVGAGGHITGGGYGLLSRLHGLTVDHLTAIDIVTWDESARRATLRQVSGTSADSDERDLFWALRGGGGGNFGVIVRYYFADPPVAPTHASIYTLAWDWAEMTEASFARLLAEYADVVAAMPPEEFTLLKLNHAGAGQIGLLWQRAAPPGTDLGAHVTASEECVARITRQLGAAATTTRLAIPLCGSPGLMSVPPSSASVEHLSYLEALQLLNGSGPNRNGKYKSAYLNRAMPDDQVAATYEWLRRTPPGLSDSDLSSSLLQVDSYGGAVNTVAGSATADPHRSSLLKLQYQTYWTTDAALGAPPTPEQQARSDAHLAWIRGFYEQVYAAYGGTPNPARDSTGTVDGCYVNYPDVDLGTHADGRVDEALQLYFGANLRGGTRSLVAVKRRWDPADVFHHSQSIPVQ